MDVLINIKKFFKNLITFKGIQIDGLNSGTKIKKLVTKVCYYMQEKKKDN